MDIDSNTIASSGENTEILTETKDGNGTTISLLDTVLYKGEEYELYFILGNINNETHINLCPAKHNFDCIKAKDVVLKQKVNTTIDKIRKELLIEIENVKAK